ncbi:cytochrome P450 [Exidia glandulosa HHB12029]|uniref:Cytochrome P450 n=1 Tax=Exidia glandulosa HHB12029 TaxID=1314781 RepID=A0A165QYX3_EXIGL|nr:cytochrome P450 [Exidia glandulosa HHB12029]
MFFVPPGLTYIAPGVLKAAAVSGVVYAIQRARILPFDFPAWLSLLAAPAWFLIRPLVVNFLHERERKRLGGARIPVCKGKKYGNLDLLEEMLWTREHGYWGELIPKLIAQYGQTFNMKILSDNQISTGDPDNVKAILATDFPSFEKGSKFHSATNSVLGAGVFNADGELWKFHRQISRPFFHRERISDFDIFARHADTAISLMLARNREGFPVELQDLTARFTLDSASEFLFGVNVHSLESALPYPGEVLNDGSKIAKPGQTLSKADEFVKAFNEAQVIISNRLWVGDMWPLFEFWKDRTIAPMKVIGAFIDPIVAQALSRKKDRAKLAEIDADSQPATLLDHLVMHTDDMKIIKDEIMNISVAGRDTTSATLTFVCYFLAMHPEVMHKLREEILHKFGTERVPTYDDLRDMKYLRAVINETLRLMPAVPVNIRQTINGVLLPSKDADGRHYYVPPRTSVSYAPWFIHRRKDLWGPDADVFDPERFIDERVRTYLTANPFIFIPFNAGPRICLGQQFAYNEVSFFLVRMLQRVKALDLAPEGQPPESRVPKEWASEPGRKGIERMRPASHLTLYSKGGLWFRITEA